MSKKLDPNRISELNGAIHRIKSLDDTMGWIDKDIENNVDEWGQKVRAILGRNRLTQWRNSFLGEVVATAIINELLAERKEIFMDICNEVECNEPPCIEQQPDRENR